MRCSREYYYSLRVVERILLWKLGNIDLYPISVLVWDHHEQAYKLWQLPIFLQVHILLLSASILAFLASLSFLSKHLSILFLSSRTHPSVHPPPSTHTQLGHSGFCSEHGKDFSTSVPTCGQFLRAVIWILPKSARQCPAISVKVTLTGNKLAYTP